MLTLINHSHAITLRHVRSLLRQPWLIAMTLAQPVVWLVLFGTLFQQGTQIPGFAVDSYIAFLTPGIVIMSALLSGGWLGAGLIEDMDRGVLERMLVSPARRLALHIGRLVQQSLITLVQTGIILLLALLLGAFFPGGVVGIAITLLSATLLAIAGGAISLAAGLLTRKGETLVILVQLMLLPLVFVSSAFMQRDLMPSWMQTVTAFNPVDWATSVARAGLLEVPIVWGAICLWLGMLLLLAIAAVAGATRALYAYQRSL